MKTLTQKQQEIIDNLTAEFFRSNAPTILMEDENVFRKVNNAIESLSTIDIDGETMQYITNQLGMKEQMSKQLFDIEKVKYEDEINSLTHYIETLQHRLRMVNDDCIALRNFINKNALEIFNKPSAQCSEAMSHLLNIEIACDLDSNECMSWNYYSHD